MIWSPYVWHMYLQNWVIFGVNVGNYSIHGASGIISHCACQYCHSDDILLYVLGNEHSNLSIVPEWSMLIRQLSTIDTIAWHDSCLEFLEIVDDRYCAIVSYYIQNFPPHPSLEFRILDYRISNVDYRISNLTWHCLGHCIATWYCYYSMSYYFQDMTVFSTLQTVADRKSTMIWPESHDTYPPVIKHGRLENAWTWTIHRWFSY